eukprot:CAMPEP_0196813972 /NCGR_PEP_ID=MMETSP1362-20130617/40493_1 /TAXON_ID=163516 /ORGANISM="Leptocylindrus danicus, Strain CCMP1856" /LENGTH=311 /DNA_ID=CAMNT_0042190431 /DNA_START=99 /DNA_END=1031 /DNA_ORIENTATION=-
MKSSKLKKRKLHSGTSVAAVIPMGHSQAGKKCSGIENITLLSNQSGNTAKFTPVVEGDRCTIGFDPRKKICSMLEWTSSNLKARSSKICQQPHAILLSYFPELSPSFKFGLIDKCRENDTQIAKDVVDTNNLAWNSERLFAHCKREHSVIGSIIFPLSACLGHLKSIDSGTKVPACLLKGNGLRFKLSRLSFPSCSASNGCTSSNVDFSPSFCHKGHDYMSHFHEIKGKICIISPKGATVRSGCDIDSSNKVAHLQLGCIRSFTEKCWLAAADADADDGDEECVGVMRYRIHLEADDDMPKHSRKELAYGW